MLWVKRWRCPLRIHIKWCEDLLLCDQRRVLFAPAERPESIWVWSQHARVLMHLIQTVKSCSERSVNISTAGNKPLRACVCLYWNARNSFGSVRIEQEREAVRASCLSYFCPVSAGGHSVWGKEEFCNALHLFSPLKPFYELVQATAHPWWHTVLSVVEKILRHSPEKESWHSLWQAMMFCVLCFLLLW